MVHARSSSPKHSMRGDRYMAHHQMFGNCRATTRNVCPARHSTYAAHWSGSVVQFQQRRETKREREKKTILFSLKWWWKKKHCFLFCALWGWKKKTFLINVGGLWPLSLSLSLREKIPFPVKHWHRQNRQSFFFPSTHTRRFPKHAIDKSAKKIWFIMFTLRRKSSTNFALKMMTGGEILYSPPPPRDIARPDISSVHVRLCQT